VFSLDDDDDDDSSNNKLAQTTTIAEERFPAHVVTGKTNRDGTKMRSTMI
jgi:hypothetical protein